MKNKVLFTIVVVVAILLISNLAFGQPFNPPDGGPAGDPPIGAPIDGGISALVVGGIAIAWRKFFKGKKDKEDKE